MNDGKKVTIEYCKDYGATKNYEGIPAWLMTEYINGVVQTTEGCETIYAKHEEFYELHTICIEYIEKGYAIEIFPYKA